LVRKVKKVRKGKELMRSWKMVVLKIENSNGNWKIAFDRELRPNGNWF